MCHSGGYSGFLAGSVCVLGIGNMIAYILGRVTLLGGGVLGGYGGEVSGIVICLWWVMGDDGDIGQVVGGGDVPL